MSAKTTTPDTAMPTPPQIMKVAHVTIKNILHVQQQRHQRYRIVIETHALSLQEEHTLTRLFPNTRAQAETLLHKEALLAAIES